MSSNFRLDAGYCITLLIAGYLFFPLKHVEGCLDGNWVIWYFFGHLRLV